MHVEVSVALNFVISYLYNKLPRTRVALLGDEIEKGLKKKFEGHWYPDKPFKGSGFRCVRVSGEKIDNVILQAAGNVGLGIEELKEYLPEDLTLWIDPDEVSYRIGEKGQIKILYSDKSEKECTETEDCEVQITNRGFNPEAQSFNPDAQSFQPIDCLSNSLGNLTISPSSGGLSPSSPVSSSSWGGSSSSSPSGGCMFPSANSSAVVNNNNSGSTLQNYLQKTGHGGNQTMFTTATFAQTKFGSTKLKTNAKRPTRLSPTEFGTIFRQKAVTFQHPDLIGPPRSRSLSPRDPRVEFMMDQQQRLLQSQQQQHLQQQFHQQQLQLQQQQLNFQLQQQQLQQQQQQQQQQFQQQRHQQHRLNIPADPHRMMNLGNPGNNMFGAGNLHDMFSGPSPLQSPVSQPQSLLSPNPSPVSTPNHSPMNSVQSSPESQKNFIDGLNMNNVSYPNQYPHLLLAT